MIQAAGALLGLIVAGGGAFAVVEEALPWAYRSELAALDARSLQWELASLEDRLYGARQACRRGDKLACDQAKKLEQRVRQVEEMLKKLRGY